MHTPEGTLERGQQPPTTSPLQQPPPHYSAPVQVLCDEDGVILQHHLMSLPNKEDCDHFKNSLARLSGEDYPLPPGATSVDDSSPEAPHPPPYDPSAAGKQGWMTGIFGCLRPVLSIIGKGVVDSRSSQDDWEIPFDQITELKFLGCGGQGAVFEAKLNNARVAVKKVSELKDTDIKNLRKLNHPNIVKFKGVCTREPQCYCIIMEYCHGTLFELLKNQKNVVTPTRVASWAKQIACGMHYLHSHKIIHRDLKSPNVLIGDEETIKISDFGTSRTWNGVSEKMSFAGTVAWMAPEAIQELACSEKVDIWSFGIVLWELLTCEVPYDGMEQGAIMYAVGTGKLRPPIPESCPDGYKLIMQMCWKMNPKERPSFKLICNHLEIASCEILERYEPKEFFKTQESWKQEIKSHMTQFCEQLQKHKIEYQMKEEQLIKLREREIKHIEDIRKIYDRKLEKVNQMYIELMGFLQQIERQRYGVRQRKFLPRFTNSRRRSSNQSTTPTSPDCTSPDSPQITPSKAPLYTKQKPMTDTVTQTTSTHTQPVISRKRHHRTNSGSPRNSRSSRSSSSRTSIVVDAETQTDSMDISETDMSPTTSCPPSGTSTSTSYPQRVILQEFRGEFNDETVNGNSTQVFTRLDPDPVSPVRDIRFDSEDTANRNIRSPRESSEEDNLETIGRKVSAIKIGSMFSPENGNISNSIGDIMRQRTRSETKDDLDSTDNAANEDSFTDEEGEIYNPTLRRRSLARRPIRRSGRYKSSLHHQHKREPCASDENTSEYSVSPSSKSSTLESNSDRCPPCPLVPNMAVKRPNDSGGSSEPEEDSDSEENMTIVTQVPAAGFRVHRGENLV
ncbi:unnamed protein product [Callosobruchus maculatus]|uniref:Mitogen-activated protein kinase kinase kinase n=1 Tax=Callosobruchus maculatus TaxID=64391 RepID=A0A653CC12_CALMS|nr:unnamed protein product [Callosobruchus maculatus]